MNQYLQTSQLIIEDRIISMKSVLDPDGLAYDFSITRTKFNLFSEISVTLYNPSDETIQAASKKGVVAGKVQPLYNISQIACDAGYNGLNKRIFSGTVFSVLTEQSATQKTTRLVVSNYSPAIAQKQIQISWKEAPKLSQALREVCSAVGASPPSINLPASADRKIGSTSFKGTFRDFIVRESSSNTDFTASVYNDTIVITSTQTNNNTAAIKELSPDTGLILTPVMTDKNMVKVNLPFWEDCAIDQPVIIKSPKFSQKDVTGSIYKYSHNVTVKGGMTTAEVLPTGQVAPLPNFGIGV
jgi:hypothetical protein